MKYSNFGRSIKGIAFRNNSGLKVPPYAVMQLDYSGDTAISLDANDIVVDIKQPDSDGAKYPGLLIFNGDREVKNGFDGLAVIDPVCLALWDSTDGTPDVGENVGAKSGSWYLSRLGKGFRVKSYDGSDAYRLSASQRTILVEPDDNVHEIVKVTSTEKDGQGFYNGVVQRYDPIGLAWQTIHACKVLDANA